MKKIIALLLALVCVISLAACGEDEPAGGAELDAFTAAVAAADPNGARIETSVSSDTFGVTLAGEYDVTYNEDGSATVAYTYEQLRLIADDTTSADGIKETLTGAATVAADGKVTVVEGNGTIGAQITAVAGIKLNLDGSKMTYSVSSGMLSATVKAENTASVLGTAIASDVNLVVTVANGSVSAITLSYSTQDGAAEIVCLYNY